MRRSHVAVRALSIGSRSPRAQTPNAARWRPAPEGADLRASEANRENRDRIQTPGQKYFFAGRRESVAVRRLRFYFVKPDAYRKVKIDFRK